jgi:hypothetical protein
MIVQAYWPFHKQACRPNQFADAMEPADPKFAAWMRAHGKLAVIKDEQVERLERAAAAPPGVQAPSRHEVMESMYGLINPAPQGEPWLFHFLQLPQLEAMKCTLPVRTHSPAKFSSTVPRAPTPACSDGACLGVSYSTGWSQQTAECQQHISPGCHMHRPHLQC